MTTKNFFKGFTEKRDFSKKYKKVASKSKEAASKMNGYMLLPKYFKRLVKNGKIF